MGREDKIICGPGGGVRPPEIKLIVAIVVRAVLDLFSKENHISRDARRWFELRAKRPEPFSFLWCCDHCELRPKELLEELQRVGCFDEEYEKRPQAIRLRLGAFISSR